MSRHNKFLEQHGCLAVLLLALIIIVLVFAVYHWVHNGYPVLYPYIKR